MKISSPNFENKSSIPAKYTCQGNNISPELDISEVPGESKSLTLILEDPDAPSGTWVHWVVWNIPPDTEKIPENVGNKLGVLGTNSSSNVAYGSPCPPSGTHRYFFKLYALGKMLDLPPGSSRDDLLKAMQDTILDQAQLMGTYKKS